MAASLNRNEPFGTGATLPPLWHWLHALKVYPLADAGPDGHEALGHFLPPLPLPRRMWAGSRFRFHAPLRIGEAVTRVSTVEAVTEKTGRTGPICFVTVRHRWSGNGTLRIDEAQDIVYRAADAPNGTPQPAPTTETFARPMRADPILLFRYSALTFNGHRIHYDRDFCATEGYAGLVVHGPLLATLLMDLLRHEGGAAPLDFTYRALAPVLADAPFTLCGRIDGDRATLWVRRADGTLAMQGEARVRDA
jgi:3-methylfumaryl-CoA hydratase